MTESIQKTLIFFLFFWYISNIVCTGIYSLSRKRLLLHVAHGNLDLQSGSQESKDLVCSCF